MEVNIVIETLPRFVMLFSSQFLVGFSNYALGPLAALVKWPAEEPNIKQSSLFDLARPSFEFVYIPVTPDKLALQELGLGARKPHIEGCRQRH